MSVHYWGEENFDWPGISDAGEFIGEGLKKWGRVNVHQYKEKFGGVRVYCTFGLQSLEQLIRPGWCYARWPVWLRVLTELGWVARKGLHVANIAVVPYHTWLYRRFYRLAVKKWPHLHDEIIEPADWHEFLEGL